MKLLFVVSGLGRGGAEEQVVLLARELSRLGHQVGIYSLSRRTERLPELEGSGVEVVVDDKRGALDPAVLWRLRRHVRRARPELVHSFGYDADVYARLAGQGSPVPVLNSERTDDQRVSRVQHLGYRLTSMLCDGVVANTRAGAEFARRLHRLGAERVDVLGNAIDLEAVDRRIARSSRPAHAVLPGAGLKRLCMVASISPVNDHPLALRVLRRLRETDPAWRLLCVGEAPAAFGAHREHVLAECNRLGLGEFVSFVGHRSDVIELIASSELLLITARHGGYPLVALEAMACNTPVVSTDWGEVRRLLPDAAQVVASRDEAEIAAAVAACHNRRAAISAAQRRWAEQHGTAAAAAAALLAVYRKHLLAGDARMEPA